LIWRRSLGCLLLLPTFALALGACGSSKSSSSSSSSASASGASSGQTVSLSISESGGKAQYTAPSTAKGGLATVTLKNQGKTPHSVQFVLVRGNHTAAEVVKQLNSSSSKTPSWIRGAGGIGVTAPGQTGTATLSLTAGKYVLTELPGPRSGPPAATQLTVTSGKAGTLPSTPTTVTAATAGKEHYKWQISGSLKQGLNKVTFNSKGSDAIHLIAGVRVTSNPSKTAVIKGLEANGKPPAFFDSTSLTETAALDGGKSQVADVTLQQPGTYYLFCPIADRNGGKPHFAKGLLTKVTVK
jgi:plastocyanin